MIYTYFEAPVSLRQVIALTLYTSEKTQSIQGVCILWVVCARFSLS